MDSGKIKKLLILGGLAIILFFGVKKIAAPAPVQSDVVEAVVEEVRYVEVLIANANIPLGTRLTSDYLSWTPWPEDSVRPSLITNAEDDRPDAMTELEGAIVRSQIYEGEPINEAKLVKAGDSGVLAAMLSPGMRAVTTRISVETAAGGFIQPGDRVDVLLTETFNLQTNQNLDNNSTGIIRDEVHIANVLFENVKVLAIDQTYATDTEGEAYVIGSTATFELSSDDSVLLQEAQSSGEISLTLRGINGSRSRARSAAKTSGYEQEAAPSDLVIYRSGNPQRVAIRGQ